MVTSRSVACYCPERIYGLRTLRTQYCVEMTMVTKALSEERNCLPPWLEVTSLPNDQEVPGSVPDSDIGYFSNGKLFHGKILPLYVRSGVNVVYPCSVFGGGPCIPLNCQFCSCSYCCRKFLHYRTFACLSIS